MNLQTYLNFSGQCEEAFRFYERVLGGKILDMHTFGNSPMASQVPPEWSGKVMHVALQVGNNMLLGSDPPPEHFHGMHGFAVCIDQKEIGEAERIFNELSEGGKVHMPFGETFWALRFAMFVDRFGTPWMINVAKPM